MSPQLFNDHGDSIIKTFVLLVFKSSFIRFCVVGAINALIYFASFYLLYNLLSMYLLLANAVAIILATFNSYVLNKIWTFRQGGGHSHRQIGSFIAVSLSGIALSSLILHTFAPRIGVPLATCLSIGVVLVWNFLLYKLLVFRRPHNHLSR